MQHDDIRHRYRWQFKAGRVVDNSVPDSWLTAISSLCANVDALIQGELRESFHWLDIKEKHGMLSVSYTAPAALTDAIDALVDGLGKPLSGAIIYIEDMPSALQAHFMAWLEQQPLSISRPPLGLPRRGQAYFAEDVLTSMDSAPH